MRTKIKPFPHYRQQDLMDCGATCLRMVCRHYGRNISIYRLRQLCQVTKNGVNLLGVSEAAEKIGFRTHGVRLTPKQLEEIPLPCILHWQQDHFVVLYQVKKGIYYIADPATGKHAYSRKEFTDNWFAHKELHQGLSLLLSPVPRFHEENEDDKGEGLRWGTVFRYFHTYHRLFIQLILGLLVGTILQLITPFLTQSVVDIGINTHNLNFIYLILIAQLALFVGQVGVEFIRSWILLHISTRVNISILTDLLIKLMKLPMKFFET